jgi:hypothetical protein
LAAAARKVIVEKLSTQRFVDSLDANSTAPHPLRQMSKSSQVTVDRAGGVAAVGQVLLVGIEVRGKRARGEPVGPIGVTETDVPHGGLPK